MHNNFHEPSDRADSGELDPIVREAVDQALKEPVPEESLQRALRRFEAIDHPSGRPRHRAWRFAAAAMAASLLLAALVWNVGENEPRVVRPPTGLDDSTPKGSVPLAEPMVTLQTYRLVLRDRPDELLALLDQRAASVFPAAPEGIDPWPSPLSRYEEWEETP